MSAEQQIEKLTNDRLVRYGGDVDVEKRIVVVRNPANRNPKRKGVLPNCVTRYYSGS